MTERRHHEPPAGLTGRWYVCLCRRPLYEHGRHKVPNAGIEEYTCVHRPSGRFEPETLPVYDWTPEKGLHAVPKPPAAAPRPAPAYGEFPPGF